MLSEWLAACAAPHPTSPLNGKEEEEKRGIRTVIGAAAERDYVGAMLLATPRTALHHFHHLSDHLTIFADDTIERIQAFKALRDHFRREPFKMVKMVGRAVTGHDKSLGMGDTRAP